MSLRRRLAAAAAAAILGAAGALAALSRSPSPEPEDPTPDKLREAGWAIGAVHLTPSPAGAEVYAEVTNLTEVPREGVFTLVIKDRDGTRVAVAQGLAVLGPGETRQVPFPGTEDFIGNGGPYSYVFEVTG